jgi:hypothetical protein
MIQNIIVLAIIIVALTKTGWELSKIIFQKNKNPSGCGECLHCELKKSLVRRE